MKKFGWIFLLFICSSLVVSSQGLRRPLPAFCTGSGAYSYRHVDVFSMIINQAALARLSGASAGIYAERRFMMNELHHVFAVAGLPARSGNFGVRWHYFGFSDYNESLAGLSYARSFGEKADAGIQLHYYNQQISNGYGSASAMGFEAGTIIHLSERLYAGIHTSNPVGYRFGPNKEQKLPSVHVLGLGFDASSVFYIGGEILKEEDRPVTVNVAFQYSPVSVLMVRAGISTATTQVWCGAGIRIKKIRLDAVASYHPHLGITPALQVLYDWNKKQQ
ncbi:MAG: hypothetical protein N2747_03805 [Chitinophagaceae bacterium]|nr:hypothetical protein [Chitinophagaceae bacterium]